MERSEAVVATRLDGADHTRPVADLVLKGAIIVRLPGDVAVRIIDAACALVAADAFGGASRCLRMAVDYAKVRKLFGRPIGAFQGVKFQLADMAVDVEPARGLYWYAAYAFDRALADASQAAAAAKAHCADVFMRAARANVEAHGGIGYTWEQEAQIYFKRAMFDFAWLGTPTDHRMRQARLAGWWRASAVAFQSPTGAATGSRCTKAMRRQTTPTALKMYSDVKVVTGCDG